MRETAPNGFQTTSAWRLILASASRLLEGTPPYPDTAVYHCQQAGEKALKAFLAAHGRPIRRVHDLVLLIDTCVGLDASFSQLAEAAEILTPYGTTFRYPGAATELGVSPIGSERV
ncbi:MULTISPECIES: HEPN domain-containing protein [unclassified Thiocapsa]|uniref:HEPN domain-containing protein n=1 Tax=unclassified Thiocapsa TaxID=2641286 RepID=UPI0035B06614